MTVAPTPAFDLYKRFRVLAYLLVLLAVAGFAYAEENPITFILISAAAVISWIIVESPRGKPLPRTIVNFGVLCTAAFLFYEVVFDPTQGRNASPNLLLILGHFMTGILICKFFDRKTNRDYAQIFTLTLLIMVAGAIFSASLFFASILVAYLGLAFYAIMLLHLRAETESAILGRLINSNLSNLADPLLRRDIRRVTSWSMVLLALVAVGAFLLLPRTRGSGLVYGWSANSTFRTGFSDRVHLGDYGELRQNNAVAMEVRLEQDGVNIGSEYYQPYFRGLALDTYDSHNRQWIRSGYLFPQDYSFSPNVREIPAPANTPVPLRPQQNSSGTPQITQQYRIQGNVGSVLFTLAPASTFQSDTNLVISFADRENTLLLRGQPLSSLRYTITSDLIAHTNIDEPTFVTPVDIPDEVSSLARQLLNGIVPVPPPGEHIRAQDIRLAADRFEDYLRTSYPYSLTQHSVNSSLDPTADFLLNCKDSGGPCTYFASAMVMLCRSVGINARMVTGYHGGEFNSISGNYIVREKYAHAWAELFFSGRGWVTFDPTPASGDTPSQLPFSNLFRDLAEIVQRDWLSSIIGFDNASRSSVFGYVRSIFAGIPDQLRHLANDWGLTLEEFAFSRTTTWSDKILGTGSAIFIAWMVFWLTYRWNRRRTSPITRILRKVDRRIQRQLAQDLLFFEEFLRLLARTGARRSPDQTPREYVELLAPRFRSASADALWLVNTYYDVRFGATRTTPSLRNQIARALTNIRHELNH
ncbi:MAG TPA: DUF3488 and transglutaminase-like domain-containing protein [Phycisphaerae bacterium]|nr:DUF3488 and transglutaminase-like domain-containing protein [Phycisphaerae bacterium]